MPAAIVKWRHIAGVVLTSPAEVMSVDLEAFTETKPLILGGEGGIHYVEFTVKNPSGVVISRVRKSTLEWRFPNFSKAPSPLPSAPVGLMGGAVLYGITLAANSLPYGKITVSAKAVSQKGTETTIGDTWFWNNSDGVARLGSSKKIYVNASTGNDLNAGTIGSQVRTIVRALELVRNNPAGSTLADKHAGGGEIICTGDFIGVGAFTSVEWHTGGDQWLTITSSGATFKRGVTGNFFPCPGISNSGTMWVRWVNWTLTGQGPQFFMGSYPSTTATMQVWWDGLVATPDLWNSSRPWDVRYAPLGGSGDPTVVDGPNPERIREIITCAQFKGRGASYGAWYMHDVKVSPYIAIAFQSNQPRNNNGSIFNVLIEGQRYVTPDIHGLWHSRGTNLVVTVPAAGQMRVEQVGSVIMLANSAGFVNLPGNPTIELDVQLAQMPGFTDWVYEFTGCANAGNNGKFACTAVGRTGGGNPFAVFSNPSAVPETLSSTVRILTARQGGGQTWYGAVHPDLHQLNTDCTELVVSHFAARDISNTQGHFGGGHTHIRCVFAYMTDGGGPDFSNNFAGCDLVDCLFVHNSFGSGLALTSATLSGSSFEENVFNDVSGSPSIATSWWRGNHFITGLAYKS